MVGTSIKVPEKMGTTISTISGQALYSHTEVEDSNERWNDNWETRRGEYVIHSGNKHHVYIVRG